MAGAMLSQASSKACFSNVTISGAKGAASSSFCASIARSPGQGSPAHSHTPLDPEKAVKIDGNFPYHRRKPWLGCCRSDCPVVRTDGAGGSPTTVGASAAQVSASRTSQSDDAASLPLEREPSVFAQIG